MWLLLCLITGTIIVIYISLALNAANNTLVLPLDDTYIHFQYARQMATGHPFIYYSAR
jgi:hypothetical protein